MQLCMVRADDEHGDVIALMAEHGDAIALMARLLHAAAFVELQVRSLATSTAM